MTDSAAPLGFVGLLLLVVVIALVVFLLSVHTVLRRIAEALEKIADVEPPEPEETSPSQD